ncbi:MAG: DUF308 domain-containing protein [Clostridia bacterium]|nr:DUF308 domain-containing protein [Clostridia bacterium]
MELLKKFGVLTALVMIAAGILCIIYTSQISAMIGIVIGAAILVVGAYYGITAMIVKSAGKSFILNLIIAIVLVIMGFVLIFYSDLTVRLVGIGIGVVAFAAGLERFRMAAARKNEGDPILPTIVTGLIHMAFGVMMCIMPTYGVGVLVLFIGSYLIVSGMLIMLSVLKFRDL